MVNQSSIKYMQHSHTIASSKATSAVDSPTKTNRKNKARFDLLIKTCAIIIFFLLSFSAYRAEAATDHQTVENGSYKVVMHKYEGAQTDILEVTNFAPGQTLQFAAWQLFAEWPVSVDIYLKPISSWFDDPNSTLSGYLMIPVYYNFYANSRIFSDMADIDSSFHVPWSNLIYQDNNLFPNFSNSGNITFNYFSRGGTYWLGLMLDSVPVASLRQNDDSYRISANFIFKGSFIYQATQCYIVESDSYRARYNPLMNLAMTTGISSTWVSNLSLDTPLQNLIANGINNSTDIDTIINLLSAISSSQTLVNGIVPYINNIDSVLSSIYSYISSATTSYNTLLNSILSECQNENTTLTNIYNLFKSGGTLNTYMYNMVLQLQNSYTSLSNTYNMINRFIQAMAGNPFNSVDTIKTNLTDYWVSVIQKAISDFEVNIQIDQDNSVQIEVTDNDVTNIYNNQQTVNNFESNIILDFERYIQTVDFTLIDPQNGPTGLVQATAAGKGWIESLFNAMGPYNYLIVVTLLVGLVAGLIGPINRFIVSRFK